MRVTESDYRLACLIRFFCVGRKGNDGYYTGSQTRANPYSIQEITDNLKYLAGKYNVQDYLDAAERVMERYEWENA